jgi:NADH:ubiquinone oxidoreductase subunit D
MNKLPFLVDRYQVREGGVYLQEANGDKLNRMFIKVTYATGSVPILKDILESMKMRQTPSKMPE